MTRKSEVRARMVEAGQALLSRHGYGITLLDVIDEADTPRGSIYYHFPRGKDELAVEVMGKVAGELEGLVASFGRKVEDPAEFLQALVEHHSKRLVRSDFNEGCPILGITVSAATDSVELKTSIESTFTRWIAAIAAVLAEKGIDSSLSTQLATTVTASIEGAIVIGRALRSADPLQQVKASIPALVRGSLSADK